MNASENDGRGQNRPRLPMEMIPQVNRAGRRGTDQDEEPPSTMPPRPRTAKVYCRRPSDEGEIPVLHQSPRKGEMGWCDELFRELIP